MAKKFGKFLLFSALAGAAAYGAYQYMQNKSNTVPSPETDEDTDDDFDDFTEDLDEEPAPRERSYVSLNLDKAEAFATEAFRKAKTVIADSVQQVKETVKSVTEGQSFQEGNFTDLTSLKNDTADAVKEAVSELKETVSDLAEDAGDAAQDAAETLTDKARDVADAVESTADSFFSEDSSDVAAFQSAVDEKVENFFDDNV